MKARLTVFGGTADGRRLAQELSGRGAPVTLCTATGYGGELAPPKENLQVVSRRMDAGEMAEFLRARGAELVVDATHPYAGQATENIRAACDALGLERLRLVRPPGEDGGVHAVADAGAAAAFLAERAGTALLTVGSKELEAFCALPGYRQRLFVRVLPLVEVLEKCLALGYPAGRLLCMQGPFSREMNAAMLHETGARWLVTKDSGPEGGYGEKLSAAREAGAEVLVIRRPTEEQGMTYREVVKALVSRLDLGDPPRREEAFPRFPLFIDLADKPVLVAGGGAVALRRVRTLIRFGASVRVSAPEALAPLRDLAEQKRIRWVPRAYLPEDLAGAALAVAATGSRQVNAQIAADAQAAGIPVSVADHREEGTFWFPAVARRGDLVAGVTSASADHTAVARAAAELRQFWGEIED